MGYQSLQVGKFVFALAAALGCLFFVIGAGLWVALESGVFSQAKNDCGFTGLLAEQFYRQTGIPSVVNESWWFIPRDIVNSTAGKTEFNLTGLPDQKGGVSTTALVAEFYVHHPSRRLYVSFFSPEKYESSWARRTLAVSSDSLVYGRFAGPMHQYVFPAYSVSLKNRDGHAGESSDLRLYNYFELLSRIGQLLSEKNVRLDLDQIVSELEKSARNQTRSVAWHSDLRFLILTLCLLAIGIASAGLLGLYRNYREFSAGLRGNQVALEQAGGNMPLPGFLSFVFVWRLDKLASDWIISAHRLRSAFIFRNRKRVRAASFKQSSLAANQGGLKKVGSSENNHEAKIAELVSRCESLRNVFPEIPNSVAHGLIKQAQESQNFREKRKLLVAAIAIMRKANQDEEGRRRLRNK